MKCRQSRGRKRLGSKIRRHAAEHHVRRNVVAETAEGLWLLSCGHVERPIGARGYVACSTCTRLAEGR